jgi:hypothetical protein
MTHHFFRDPRTVQRLHEGPLGPYLEAFAAEMHAEGYAQETAELQIRLVADFSHWLAKRRIPAWEITAEHFPSYLRSCAQNRRPGRSDRAALQRLRHLLLRQGVIPKPPMPAPTPADHLQDTFRRYLQQERALAPATLVYYLAFAREFLTARFGAGPVDLAALCAADVTGFVQRRAATFWRIWIGRLGGSRCAAKGAARPTCPSPWRSGRRSLRTCRPAARRQPLRVPPGTGASRQLQGLGGDRLHCEACAGRRGD